MYRGIVYYTGQGLGEFGAGAEHGGLSDHRHGHLRLQQQYEAEARDDVRGEPGGESLLCHGHGPERGGKLTATS